MKEDTFPLLVISFVPAATLYTAAPLWITQETLTRLSDCAVRVLASYPFFLLISVATLHAVSGRNDIRENREIYEEVIRQHWKSIVFSGTALAGSVLFSLCSPLESLTISVVTLLALCTMSVISLISLIYLVRSYRRLLIHLDLL